MLPSANAELDSTSQLVGELFNNMVKAKPRKLRKKANNFKME